MNTSPRHGAEQLLLAARQPLVEGRFAEARQLVARYLDSAVDDARGWGLLARCERELGSLDGAQRAAERALALTPAFPPVLMELGLIERARGNREQSAHWLRQCLERSPGNAACRWELAVTLAPQSPRGALEVLQPLRLANPVPEAAILLQAALHRRLGELKEACALYDELLLGGRESVDALEGAYWVRVQANRDLPARIELARRLTAIAPNGERWMNLAQEFLNAGDFPAGRAATEAAASQDPDFLPARWGRFQIPPTVAPASIDGMESFKRDWESGLAYFESLDPDAPEVKRHLWGCVGQCTAFYRHYLGDEVTALQRRYGRLLGRMMGALAPAGQMRPLRAGRRRIGICSAHLFQHTVTRLFGPLIEALDRNLFELHLFSVKPKEDEWSARYRACGEFHDQIGEATEWRDRILDADLDMLLYLEVGMNPLIQGLAALRLAPVQMVLWGHPVSTGLDSVDLFLSADALEPEHAQEHYSERLVRLPGVGHGIAPEDLCTPAPPPFPLRPDAIELLCAQTVFKLLPQQDRLFARILAALPEARLHLLADDREPVRRWLRERMEPTLREHGVDPDRQLCIHGFVEHEHYLGLARSMRLNLDSIGWSGGMSALDLLAQGLPTVCLPGQNMRSRQTAALLLRLEVEELIARDEDDYVEKAIALARSPQRCAELSARLQERRGRLFASPDTAAFLNRLLSGVQRDAAGGLILP